MIDVHSKVAMAPSTAEPPNSSISLGGGGGGGGGAELVIYL